MLSLESRPKVDVWPERGKEWGKGLEEMAGVGSGGRGKMG